MNGSDFLLLDTNIILYYLRGHTDGLVDMVNTKVALVSVLPLEREGAAMELCPSGGSGKKGVKSCLTLTTLPQ